MGAVSHERLVPFLVSKKIHAPLWTWRVLHTHHVGSTADEIWGDRGAASQHRRVLEGGEVALGIGG